MTDDSPAEPGPSASGTQSTVDEDVTDSGEPGPVDGGDTTGGREPGTGNRRDEADSGEPGADDGASEPAVGRRPYLGLVGATAAALAGCMDGESDNRSTATPTPTQSQTDDPEPTEDTPTATPSRKERFSDHRDIQFDRVLDAVEDLGLDPSGEVAVEETLTGALSVPGTLLLFPEGRYRFAASVNLTAERVGLLGTGEVSFVPDPGFGSLLIDGQADTLDDVLIENVDVDVRAPDTTAGIRLKSRNRFHVEDVEYVGRGTNDSPGGTTSAFLFAISSDDGRGLLRNAVAKKGSRIDGYEGGNGRIGVWVGWTNKGTVRIEDCDFREFGNNAIYASRTPGQVEVVDSYFRNNNASSVRIGGEGSYVENCTVEIDIEKYTGPPPDTETEFNTRGIVVEQGLTKPGPPLPAGAEIRGCTLHARRSPRSQAVIEQSPQARSLRIRDTEIQCDIDGTPAIRRGPPGSIAYRPDREKPPMPHWTRLQNVTIGGSAAGGAAVNLRLAPESRVENCEIVAEGADRDGVVLDLSPKSSIFGSEIRTDGHPIVVAVERTASPERHLLCLGLETGLERFDDVGAASTLISDPPLFQTLTRNSRTDAVCLGLAPDVPSLSLVESVTGRLRISIDRLEDGVPLGQLLNDH
jgi:hypothetical protein